MSPLAGIAEADIPGAPAARAVAPASLQEVATVLEHASDQHAAVLVWGGGTHQGHGGRVDAEIVLSTERLQRVVAYEPEDLTAVVEAGVRVSDLEAMLGERGQTALLPEHPGTATVGGVVASGVSGWRRGRWGPTRDRVLEVELVTGDGRTVRAGGRVVKNVTGYDLPRLVTGSYGSLGLVGTVCLKLYPLPAMQATVEVGSAVDAVHATYRPWAVIEEPERTRVYLGGTEAEVVGQAERLGGAIEPGWVWPQPMGEDVQVSIRVPPRHTPDVVARLPAGTSFAAQHGVGEVAAGFADFDAGVLGDLRSWAEGLGGALVLIAAPDHAYGVFDPWGTPPETLDLQRRVIARFDPVRVVNPGRLPGGI